MALSSIRQFLIAILSQAAKAESMGWLDDQIARINGARGNMKLFLAFSQASRYFSKDTFQLTDQQVAAAQELRPGFQPSFWTALQTARTVLVLGVLSEENESWMPTLDQLFESADMHELEALYAALPLYPFPEKLKKRASEGLRTNITSVFDAIALNNPYPSEYLDEPAWNQLLLKAIFMQRPLYRITGAEERANANLAKTLVDYVHERWSAGRNVMPELWRFLSPFVDQETLGMFEKVLKEGDELDRKAVSLACFHGKGAECRELLDQFPDHLEAIEKGELNWVLVGKAFDSER
ncbi:EboA domain-containing protein [Cyclobacterium sp. SYSU L10401]|uniref:EboA domain-containing protein n=1 Tax=Cyclobacterium sp. SYSU L10401 TaxID=2678657 RepID=UPI0013D744F9|nr:EboA domain-containing protein [Cyclobacterium sp. SYSU L10401]